MTGTKKCCLPFPTTGKKKVKLKLVVSGSNKFVTFGQLNTYDLFSLDEKICAKMSPYEYTVLTTNTKYVNLRPLDNKKVVEFLNIDQYKKE